MRNQSAVFSLQSSVLVVAAFGALAGCSPKAPPAAPAGATTGLTIATVATLPTTPTDGAWEGATPFTVKLLPQDVTEPRLREVTVPEAEARVVSDGKTLAVRLTWADATRDDDLALQKFPDACAVQLPGIVGPDVPDAQMGQPGRPVLITLWKAHWQAIAEGRPATIARMFPNALIDYYPHGDHVSANVVGNPMASPPDKRTSQDLEAEGFGSLRRAATQASVAKGVYADGKWTVVLTRPLPGPITKTYLAFAVWDGGKGNVGARKMRSEWVGAAVKP